MLGGLLGLVGLSAIAGILVTATVTPAIAVSGYAASSAISLFDSLPGNLQIDRPMEPTTIYAQKGDGSGESYPLATFYDQNREPVEYNQVSPYVYDALLSTEDPRFFEHGGVDLIGTGRALLSNAVSDSTQGGSSISQQYVKGVQLQVCERTATTEEELADCANKASTADGTAGYQRKLQEMRYAIAIEQEYSKEQILIGYLNLVNFGGSTYGIEAAAQYYFDTTAKDLTLNQAATLVGIINNPNTLRLDYPDSETNGKDNGYAAATKRRDQVLGRMLTEGTISQKQHDEAVEQAVDPRITQRVKGCSAAAGSAYFCQYVMNSVLSDERYNEAFGEDTADRQDLLYRGGLEIYTTLDNGLQYEAQQAMQNQVPQYRDGMDLGAATVQLDTHTGNILSLAQNTRFVETQTDAPGETSLIYAANNAYGGGIGFPAGSTYKIFTVIDWLKQGRSANEYLDGRAFQPRTFTCDGQFSETKTHKNTDNFNQVGGSVNSVRNFVGQSLNTGFYAMASQLDVCEIHELADSMGVKLGSGDPIMSMPGHAGPFSVVGSANIAPMDMATAYATVANGGVRCEPTAIVRVVSPDGKELPMPDTKCERVLDENVAATTAYTMSRVMEPGQTGALANVGDGIPTFGKTGTHENIHTWMIQTSTNVTSAAWIGNATGGTLGGQGDMFAAGLQNIRYSLSKALQSAANVKYGGEGFPEPDPNLVKVTRHPVPNVVGMSVDQATQTLRDKGFQVRVDPNPVHGDQEEGLVETSNPSGEAPAGSQITLQVSDGKGSIQVPKVEGMNLAKASDAMWAANINLYLSCVESKDAPAEGKVIKVDPPAGTYVHEDDKVVVTHESKKCGKD